MRVLIVFVLYFLVGAVVNHFYKKKDLKNSITIEEIIDNSVAGPNSWWLSKEIQKKSIDYAGWCYWRRKPPFDKLSIGVKNVIAFPFWIFDDILCEIGYWRELKYVNTHCLKGE